MRRPACLLVCLLSTSFALSAVRPTLPDLPPRRSPQKTAFVRRAGMIFAGTVLAIARVPNTRRDQVPSVQITFRIDRGIVGTQTGKTVSIREWAGLWTDRPRYVVGEQVVLVLYAPSALGLTSPVGGPQGVFRVEAGNRVRVSPWQRPWLEQQGLHPIHDELIPLEDLVRHLRTAVGGTQ